ncbi:MAG: uncharacterized protein PWR10_2251 [Halanaerobiales bacterium]|nr:uncharacterized protein [Halanaerobiales bacterium]
MLEKRLIMKVLKEKFGVCRLDSTALIPDWSKNSEFFSITKTSYELSIVCSQDSIPNDIKCEKDWRILKVEGPLDFSLTGVLASISTTLAQQGISIFAISTYDTDYILIKDKDIENAVNALSNEGHQIRI